MSFVCEFGSDPWIEKINILHFFDCHLLIGIKNVTPTGKKIIYIYICQSVIFHNIMICPDRDAATQFPSNH